MSTTYEMPTKKRPKPDRDRIDLRAEPEWIEWITETARIFGLSLSAYIRQATTRQAQIDNPKPSGRKRTS